MPFHRSSRRSFVARLLFALALLFAQQRGLVHALEHDVQRLHQQDATGHGESFCAQCLAVAHFDPMDGPAGAAFVPPPFVPVRLDTVGRPDASVAPIARYRSRAPPLFS